MCNEINNLGLKKIKIYSDGGARPNPGPGGYGIILRFGKIDKEFSGFEKYTTNNRMELTGVIIGLSKLNEKCDVQIFTDSSYVVNGIEQGWAEKWKKNKWMRTKSEKAINYDLWEKLLEEVSKHKVKFNWVRGHNGHLENEKCDELATNEILKNIVNKKIVKKDLLQKVLNTEKKIKIEKIGDKCRKCGIPVIKTIPKKKNTKNKSYYYEYYLTCPNCKTNYFINEAKVEN